MNRIEAADLALQAVLEAIADGVWVLDHAGRTVFANQRGVELLHVTDTERARTNLYHYVTDATSHAAPLRPGDRSQHDVAVINGDHMIWIRLTIIARFTTQGRPDGHIIMLNPADAAPALPSGDYAR